MRALTRLLAVAGTLALASCGGSDDDESDKTTASTTTTKTEVTRASYIATADAFCQKSNATAKQLNLRAQTAIRAQSDDVARLAALEPILKQALTRQTTQNKEFAAIPGPPEDAATADKLKGAYHRRLTLLGMLTDAATRRDVKQFTSITAQQERLTKRVVKIARGYGFKECGSRRNEAD